MTNESECRSWAAKDPLLAEYHDNEWCHISHDDRYIFEMLCLEGQSVGLSWRTIINKRQAYKKAFFDFDIDKCASLTDEYLDKQMENPDLIKQKKKIYSIRDNAIAVKKIIDTYGSFEVFVWSYTGGEQIVGNWEKLSDVPTQTEISRLMSKDLKKAGLSFVGPVITYSFMQAIGMVNDHLADCEHQTQEPEDEDID